jgi:hypothetical protein
MKGSTKAAVVCGTLLHLGLVGQTGDPLAALNKAEATWTARRPQGYEFTLDVRCFCPLAGHPVAFRVEGQKSQLLDDVDIRVRPSYEYYNTIEKLLAILRREVTRSPFKMVVSYDENFGYPLQADLDPRQDIVDDELFFRVTTFKPAAPLPAIRALSNRALEPTAFAGLAFSKASQRRGSAPWR